MIKIALGQMEITPGQPLSNAQKMLLMINEAKKQNAQLIVFPAMSITGSLLGSAWEQPSFLRECESIGQNIIEKSEGIAIIFGAWQKPLPQKYSACFIAQNGANLLREKFFSPDGENTVKLNLGGQKIKIWCRILTGNTDEVLENWENKDRPDLVINLASSYFMPGKNKKNSLFFQESAKKLQAHFLYVNSVGIQNNGKTVYAFDGLSSLYGKDGSLLHLCPEFQEDLAFIELDLKGNREAKKFLSNNDETIESIFRAIDYTLPKFLQSLKQNRVVIGASGGIDSALNAALYARCIGAENLLLVNMPSKFNSATTKNAAYELAANLGCLYTVMPIDQSVANTTLQINETPVLTAGKDFHLNLTQFMTENIQARDRSARLLAGIAAAFGAVFTCNANKSEMTIGYSTLYGDLAGFFAVTADLWKYQVYELAHYLNETVYAREIIPRASLTLVPSAELSFAQNVDKGQGDPLIYSYHDYLFKALAEDDRRLIPEDILARYLEGTLEEKIGCAKGLVSKIFKSSAEFIADLEKWWSLYTGLGSAKRMQAPPVLSLSARAYGSEYQESQNGTYYTQEYLRLKETLGGKILCPSHPFRQQ